MGKVSNNILYIVIAILVGIVIHLYINDDSDDLDTEVKAYKEAMHALKEEAFIQKKKTDSLIARRDSAMVELLNKQKEDKKVIHEKFEKKRSDILVLTDDESVQLLSKNLGGR